MCNYTMIVGDKFSFLVLIETPPLCRNEGLEKDTNGYLHKIMYLGHIWDG